METDEDIEVAPSEETGNVPAEAPSEEPKDTEAEPIAEPVKEPEVELFDLPDGRKVDAATLSREWKENFMPDYTKKATAVKQFEKENNNETPKNPLDDPNYIPPTYAELARQIKEQTLAELESKEQARVEQRQAIENEVAAQLLELKKTDPTLNENALFLHANKYGFRDLKVAHQNMRDIAEAVKKVQTTTAANIAKRNDPVSTTSTTPGSGGSRPDPSSFANAIEYLRSLK
jgi:hypothetical protein